MKGEQIQIRVLPVFIKPINPFDIIDEGFTGDWRQGQEIKKVAITKRFYQVSSNSSEAWFSNYSKSKDLKSWLKPGLRKLNQPFIRIQIESDNPEKFLRPFNQSMPTEIAIAYEGYKRFKNVTIRTEVSFQLNIEI